MTNDELYKVLMDLSKAAKAVQADQIHGAKVLSKHPEAKTSADICAKGFGYFAECIEDLANKVKQTQPIAPPPYVPPPVYGFTPDY